MSMLEILVLILVSLVIIFLCIMNHKEIQELKKLYPKLSTLVNCEKNINVVRSAINLEIKLLNLNINELEKSFKYLVPISSIIVAYNFVTYSTFFFLFFMLNVFIYLFSKATLLKHYKVVKVTIEKLSK